MDPKNLLFILSDQHAADVLGSGGNQVVTTPHLDRLAARGTRFENAYCASPVCVPSRASIATGRYPHDIGAWDNAKPYTGAEAPSWGHRLAEHDCPVTTIGKLHFRSSGDDTGFPDQRLPLHVIEKTGNMIGLLRGDMPPLPGRGEDMLSARAGKSSYTAYDRAIADVACQWLHDEASTHDRPWVLFVSFVCPHPPLIAPPEFLSLYHRETMPLPPQWQPETWLRHPVLDMKRQNDMPPQPLTESQVRQALAAYYGLVSFLDAQIGRVLQALDETGLAQETRVIYASDHGDTLGANGQWGKCSMLEGAVKVPLILAGPDVQEGRVEAQPVSLVDCFPSVLDAVGVPPSPDDEDLPGRSLWRLLDDPEPSRPVFAEYHATHSPQAIYMLRDKRYKYVHYTGYQPQLFDLGNDPTETNDLAADPASATMVADFERRLRGIVDPEEVDNRARSDQQRRVRAAGGRRAVIARSSSFRGTPAPKEFRDDG